MISAPSGSLPVSFGGHTLQIISSSPRILSAMQTHLRHCPAQKAAEILSRFTVTEDDGAFSLTADDAPLFSKLPYDFALQNLLTEAISRLVAVCERGLVIHAAALAQDGNAVILSGQGGSGKSTLAAQLTADGLTYLTDEVIEACDERHRSVIHTFPRSIFLKRGSSFLWKKRLPEIDSPRFLKFYDDAAWIDPQLFNPQTLPAAQGLPRLIIFPRYVQDAPLRAARLTQGETLFHILQNATNARNLPRHSMDAATTLAQRVTAYTLTYSNLDEASALIRDSLTHCPVDSLNR